MWQSLRAVVAVVGVALVGVPVPVSPAAAVAADQLRMVDLGAGDGSVAYAINQAGHVVGERGGRAFLWRNGRFTDLGTLGGEFSVATDVNNHDEIVGYSSVTVGGPVHAFRWRRGHLTDLGVLGEGGQSYAHAINDRGDVVGHGTTGPDEHLAGHAWLWRNAAMHDLDIGGGSGSGAVDINNAGDIAGWNGLYAVRWRRGVMQILDREIGTATAINGRGHVVGFSGQPVIHGFVWYRGRLTRISARPGETWLGPRGINNRAQVVGATPAGAFLWQRGRLTLLPAPPGATDAYDINDRGQIVGYSTRPQGHTRAVLWTR